VVVVVARLLQPGLMCPEIGDAPRDVGPLGPRSVVNFLFLPLLRHRDALQAHLFGKFQQSRQLRVNADERFAIDITRVAAAGQHVMATNCGAKLVIAKERITCPPHDSVGPQVVDRHCWRKMIRACARLFIDRRQFIFFLAA
jgi:hypothetical protein